MPTEPPFSRDKNLISEKRGSCDRNSYAHILCGAPTADITQRRVLVGGQPAAPNGLFD